VLDAIVLGLGVNVREDPAASDPALRGGATSIALLSGASPDPGDVGAAILARLLVRHAELVAGAAGTLLAAWRARSVPWWGQLVEVVSVGQPERGRALDVDAGGALLLTRPDGSVARVLAGEARELRLGGGGTP
jgi:biotin-(acetyl-CoA carboxylase) ligase